MSCASLNNGLTKIFDTNDRFVQKQIIDFEMEKDGEAKMFSKFKYSFLWCVYCSFKYEINYSGPNIMKYKNLKKQHEISLNTDKHVLLLQPPEHELK